MFTPYPHLQEHGEQEAGPGEDGGGASAPALSDAGDALGVHDQRRNAKHSCRHARQAVDNVPACNTSGYGGYTN